MSNLILLAALVLSTVTALATLLTAVSASWRITTLGRTPGCAAALTAAVAFWKC